MKRKSITKLRGLLLGEGRLSARFRNISIFLFLLAFFIMAWVTVATVNRIISKISSDYAGRYAISSADALSAHIAKEVSLLSAAARSNAVMEWLADEFDDEKQYHAYSELSSIISGLYSSNLYVVALGSLNEYKIEGEYPQSGMVPFNTLNEDAPADSWFFDSIVPQYEYTLNVAMDELQHSKRVWINYKVTIGGTAIGLISTGLEFSHVAGELFAQFNPDTTRGFIIDEKGIVYMDSAMLGKEELLQSGFETAIEEIYPEPKLISAVRKHLDSADGHFNPSSLPVIAALTPAPYRHATIAPIKFTNWTAVIIYDSSSSLDMPLFLPTAVAMLIVLVAFALSINAVSYRMLFLPLGRLRKSLLKLNEFNEGNVYGIERGDELGELSQAIKDWFTKANYDALTGIHNRRFMESNLQHIMGILMRTRGIISMLMVDVDFFKRYNDTYGHEQGDACLRAIATAVAGSIGRSSDFAARYGGEEFVLILPNTEQSGAISIAEKLIENVRKLNLPHEASDAADYVTISVGVTTGKVNYGQSWEDFLKRADEAMYESKQTGRNKYTFLES